MHGCSWCGKCAQRKKFSQKWGVWAFRHGRHLREALTLLVLRLALTAVGVASCTDLDHVENNGLKNCADTSKEKNQAQPVVPYIRCEHDANRSH